MPMNFCIILFVLAILRDSCVKSAEVVLMEQMGYSYVFPAAIGGVAYSRMIADSGFSSVVTYNETDIFNITNFGGYDVCVNLQEDYYDTIQFVAVNGGNTSAYNDLTCSPENDGSVLEIGSAEAFVNYSNSFYLGIENPILHNWANCTGDIGLAYNYYDPSDTTQFQSVLMNATEIPGDNLIFGLDFNKNPEVSSMQMGGVSAVYGDELNWALQGDESPQYHMVMIENLNFCGVNLLQEFASTWNVIVDSGSSCITLPAEIYDTFDAWFTNESAIVDEYSLPALTFKVSNLVDGPDSTMYIPLTSLVLPPDAIEDEIGAPWVTSAELGLQRVCVIKGGNIVDNSPSSQKPYFSPPPTIIFGSLVLQSVYFAADFTDKSVGLANKLSSTQMNGFEESVLGCASSPVCKGSQHFSRKKNTCINPACDLYFVTEMDSNTYECVFKKSSMITGLFFVLLFATLEIICYFVVQYSATILVNGRRQNENYSLIGVGPFTKEVGRILSKLIDWIVIHVLGWAAAPRLGPAGRGIQLQNPV